MVNLGIQSNLSSVVLSSNDQGLGQGVRVNVAVAGVVEARFNLIGRDRRVKVKGEKRDALICILINTMTYTNDLY